MSDITNQDLKDLILALDKKNELRFAEMDKKNELRFAEMDKKMEVGFAEMDKKMEVGFAEMDKKMEVGFAEMDKKIEVGFAEMDKKMEVGFTELKGEIKRVEDKLIEKASGIDKRLGNEELVSRTAFISIFVAGISSVTKYFFFSDKAP